EEFHDAGDIRMIEISSGSTDVEIVQGTSEQIVTKLTDNKFGLFKGRTRLHHDRSGGTLSLKVDHSGGMWDFGERRLTVELPEKQWEQVRMSMGSGDVTIEGIGSDRIAIEAGSGDVLLDSLTANQLDVRTSSGDLEALRYEAERFT